MAETIPEAQRSTRNELIEIANAYFEGLQRNDGKGFYPFTDDCDRIENGAHTTNNPSGPTTAGGFNYMALDCKKQLESGYLAIVTNIHQRRYPLVDEERGVVWSNCDLGLGRHRQVDTLDQRRDGRHERLRRPSVEHRGHGAFKIENGKIRRVEMIGPSVPYLFGSARGGSAAATRSAPGGNNH